MGNEISTKMASGPPLLPGIRPAADSLRPGDAESSKEIEARHEEKARQANAIDEVVSGLNEMVQNLHRHLQFSVEEKTGETIIKVVDSDTNEVVRQIPSEEIIRLRQRMKEAAGVLFQGAV
ncbi:MAG: flagellar protein FlaG [Gammaproteobacteria bacterium]|nr:MAG: flagellar protein FlaG [Gammaproteobacteria bacterium]